MFMEFVRRLSSTYHVILGVGMPPADEHSSCTVWPVIGELVCPWYVIAGYPGGPEIKQEWKNKELFFL